jgi:hypothetical protein
MRASSPNEWRTTKLAWAIGLALCSYALLVDAAFPQVVTDGQVRAATLNRPNDRGPNETVRFARRPPQIGDVIEQSIAQEMRLTTVQRQGNQVADTSTAEVRNHQRRIVTTTRVEKGRTIAVQVKYVEAGKQATEGESPAASPQFATEAVAGKSYRCQRAGEKLVVTDEQGHVPPPVELERVAGDMEAIGRANPLAEYLNGRTVAVGETLQIPLEVADRLLDLRPDFGKLSRFELTLREVRDEGGVRCAVFQAMLEAVSRDSSQMHLQIAGPMVVQVDSCRAVSSNLSGPIAMSESRGSYSAAYQLISTGKLSLSLASLYRDAVR